MANEKAKTIRWGIMATGGIARTFTKDLMVDPVTRNVNDIIHHVAAVASSSSKTGAESFIADIIAGKQPLHCTPYGDYESLCKDPDVDIIYVATPHSHHYQNCRLALSHNKPVLCEKALTVNADQTKILIQEAKKRNLFFMEAVWTRYFPLSIEVRKAIETGVIGEVLRVQSDLSVGENPEEAFDVSHRMVNMDLAGGCLLDLGIYALTWQFQTLYHTLPKEQRQKPKVVGTVITNEPRTGCDESISMLLDFPKSTPTGRTKAHGLATAAFRVHFDHKRDTDVATPAVRVFGDKGEIQVFGPIYRPSRYRIIHAGKEGKPVEDKKFEFPGGGHGMFWEADEAARCVLKGELESKGLDWEESTVIMETMDEVRKQGNLRYPEEIESTDFPIDLKARKL